jgi:dTMP kinase
MSTEISPECVAGYLVVVEGVDGSGKSTLLRRLEEECVALGRVVCRSREPTQGVWGRKVRESAREGRLSLEEELDLFIRDRKEHVRELIAPALSRGEIVLLDRYYFSTAAYQGARGADPDLIVEQNEKFAPQPDLVLLLDCEPEHALERIRARGDEPDAFEKLESLRRVREIFLRLQKPYIRVLDASESAERVSERAVHWVRSLIARD